MSKEKDITQKTLESYNDVFADIVNVLLFNGKRLVKEESLTDAQPFSLYKAEGNVKTQERDVAKFWNNHEVRIAFYGLENQTKAEKIMPLRIIGYDGASYRQQLNEKTSKLYPVVTIVLYFGYNQRWKAPQSLKECINIPEELKPFVSDYKINVFEIGWLSDETISMFTSDFKHVVQVLSALAQNKKYRPSEDEIKHAEELINLLGAVTKDKRFSDIELEDLAEIKESNGGNMNMCRIIDEFINEGRNEGMAQKARETAVNFIALGLSDDIISKGTGLSLEEVYALRKQNSENGK